jgi:hypothetical protein
MPSQLLHSKKQEQQQQHEGHRTESVSAQGAAGLSAPSTREVQVNTVGGASQVSLLQANTQAANQPGILSAPAGTAADSQTAAAVTPSFSHFFFMG